MINTDQIKLVHTLFRELGITEREDKLHWINDNFIAYGIDVKVKSIKDLTKRQTRLTIDALKVDVGAIREYEINGLKLKTECLDLEDENLRLKETIDARDEKYRQVTTDMQAEITRLTEELEGVEGG